MKKTTIVFLALLILIPILTYYVIAPLIVDYLVPQQATISNLTLTMYVDDTPWANNTVLNWGIVDAGSVNTIANFTVANTDIVAANVTIHVNNLPSGWSLTWMANKTIVQPDNYAWAALELTVAGDATPGQTYSWSMWVRGTQV